MDEEPLAGGIAHAGAVVRVGDEVRRPTSEHTPLIHAFLGHLRSVGFDGAPEPLGIDADGRERLRFIPGDVPVPPYPAWALTDAALASTGRLLRRFHEAAVGFVAPVPARWSRELADDRGAEEVVCHNDVCPENVIFRNGEAVALVDFEFAAPGRRVFDLAALASMCIPLDAPEDAARSGRDGLDPFARLRVLADAYGLPTDRNELLDVIAERFADGGAFVRRRVEAGEQAFIEMWHAMGGAERYDRRRRWFAANRRQFEDSLG
jgi:hypothetical protein